MVAACSLLLRGIVLVVKTCMDQSTDEAHEEEQDQRRQQHMKSQVLIQGSYMAA